MINTVKVCKKHGELKLENIFIRKNTNYLECRFCMRDRSRSYRISLRQNDLEKYKRIKRQNHLNTVKNNREKYLALQRERSRRWRKNNKERCKFLRKNRIDTDKIDYLNIQRLSSKKRRDELCNCYVRRLIFPKGKNINIPLGMIEAKRQLVKFKRKIKELIDDYQKC